MQEGFQRPHPDGSLGLKVERHVSLESIDNEQRVQKSTQELHEEYRAQDIKNPHDVGEWHEPSDELIRDMHTLHADIIQKNKKARTENQLNKSLAAQENEYVPSSARLSREESEQELKATIKRDHAVKKTAKKTSKKTKGEHVSPEKNNETTESSAGPTEASKVNKASQEDTPPPKSEPFKESILGRELDLKLTNAKLLKSSEQIRKSKQDLEEMQAALRETAKKRADHKEWADTLASDGTASRRQNRPGLRKIHAIPEKVFKKSDEESIALAHREEKLKTQIESKKYAIDAEQINQSELRTRAEVLLARNRESAETYITPFEEQIVRARHAQQEIQASIDRYEGFATDVEKRLADYKMQLRNVTFDSQRMVLEEMIRKDEILFGRLTSHRQGLGVNSQGPNSIEGLKKKLAATEKNIRLCESKIKARKDKMRDLESRVRMSASPESQPESTFSAFTSEQEQRRQESQQEAPKMHEEKNTQSSKESKVEKPIASISYKDKVFDILYPSAQSVDHEIDPKERLAKHYAHEWNKRYGTAFTVEPQEFARMLPGDREPDEYEMDSLLEQYLTRRPYGIWKWTPLSGIYSSVVRKRIRTMREAAQFSQ
jgi:hypothetical protein